MVRANPVTEQLLIYHDTAASQVADSPRERVVSGLLAKR